MNDSHVEFNEGGSNGSMSQGFSSKHNTSVMTKLLLKTGIIKDEKYAPIVFIAVMLVCFGLSVFIFWSVLR